MTSRTKVWFGFAAGVLLAATSVTGYAQTSSGTAAGTGTGTLGTTHSGISSVIPAAQGDFGGQI